MSTSTSASESESSSASTSASESASTSASTSESLSASESIAALDSETEEVIVPDAPVVGPAEENPVADAITDIQDPDVPLADGNDDVAPLLPTIDEEDDNIETEQQATTTIEDEETPLGAEVHSSVGGAGGKFNWWPLAILTAIAAKLGIDKKNDKGLFARRKATEDSSNENKEE